MRGLWSRIMDARLVPDLIELASSQARLLVLKEEEIKRLHYDYSKALAFCMEQFLIVLDRPEHQDVMREQVRNALSDLRDQVARYGEHV
jgi:hypothetical protein